MMATSSSEGSEKFYCNFFWIDEAIETIHMIRHLNRAAYVSVLILTLLVATCFVRAEVFAMSFFAKRVIFSEVRGIVINKGKPIEGAEIERSFHVAMGDEKGVDHTKTDASGKFILHKITKPSSLLGMLPHEPVIGQNITIKVGGREYMAWQFVKHDYDDNSELDGKPIDIICDLSTEPSRHGGIYGICRFK